MEGKGGVNREAARVPADLSAGYTKRSLPAEAGGEAGRCSGEGLVGRVGWGVYWVVGGVDIDGNEG